MFEQIEFRRAMKDVRTLMFDRFGENGFSIVDRAMSETTL